MYILLTVMSAFNMKELKKIAIKLNKKQTIYLYIMSHTLRVFGKTIIAYCCLVFFSRSVRLHIKLILKCSTLANLCTYTGECCCTPRCTPFTN